MTRGVPDGAPEDKRTSRLLFAVSGMFVILSLLVFVGLGHRYWQYTMDDSFISFRYAANFSEGNGLVFNVDEYPRSEGITSPLYAVFISTAIAGGLDPVIFSKVAGWLFSLLAAILSGLSIRNAVRGMSTISPAFSWMLAATGASWILTNPFVAGNSMSGMETGMAIFAFSCFLFFWTRLCFAGGSGRLGIVMVGLSGLLVPLCRPEMGLSVMVLLLMAVASPKRRLFSLQAMTLFLILGSIYFFWRFWYYGLLFPLPFYSKQLAGFSGWRDVAAFLQHAIFVVPFAAIACLFGLRGIFQKKPGAFYIVSLSAGIALQLFYYCTIMHIMGFGFRFFIPLLSGMAVLAFVGFCAVLRTALRSKKLREWSCLWIPTLAGLLILSNYPSLGWADYVFWDYASDSQRFGKIAHSIRSAADGGQLSIALNDCGVIPYMTRCQTIDLAGLNNRNIALGGDSASARAEILRGKPDLVFLLAGQPHNVDKLFMWEHLSNRDMMQLGYEYQGSINGTVQKDLDPGYYLLVYAYKAEMESLEVILAQLQQVGILEIP